MIPVEVENAMIEAHYIIGDTDDWIVIKSEICTWLVSEFRGLFSRRHHLTKKQDVNDFDIAVMHRWHDLTGIMPILKDDDRHSTSS